MFSVFGRFFIFSHSCARGNAQKHTSSIFATLSSNFTRRVGPCQANSRADDAAALRAGSQRLGCRPDNDNAVEIPSHLNLCRSSGSRMIWINSLAGDWPGRPAAGALRDSSSDGGHRGRPHLGGPETTQASLWPWNRHQRRCHAR